MQTSIHLYWLTNTFILAWMYFPHCGLYWLMIILHSKQPLSILLFLHYTISRMVPFYWQWSDQSDHLSRTYKSPKTQYSSYILSNLSLVCPDSRQDARKRMRRNWLKMYGNYSFPLIINKMTFSPRSGRLGKSILSEFAFITAPIQQRCKLMESFFSNTGQLGREIKQSSAK